MDTDVEQVQPISDEDLFGYPPKRKQPTYDELESAGVIPPEITAMPKPACCQDIIDQCDIPLVCTGYLPHKISDVCILRDSRRIYGLG